MARIAVRFADNFHRNLEGIQAFLIEADAATEADQLVDALFDRLIPAMEEHPRIGRDWLTRTPHSPRGDAVRARIVDRLAGKRELREIILGDYLVLYTLDDETAVLLAIRHHRQLAYEVGAGPGLKP